VLIGDGDVEVVGVAVSSMPERKKTMDVCVSLSMKRFLGRLWADLARVVMVLGCDGGLLLGCG
jgi:hypothetical protein